MRSVWDLARGIVERKVDELDADPDLLNTPSGVVDLRTGDCQHDPALLMTKITSGSYRPGSPIPTGRRRSKRYRRGAQWLQARIGQAITGHRHPTV